MQKYSATKLEIDSPDWKSQDSVTIHFPEENVLRDNNKKISEIMSLYSARSDGLEFLASYEWFKEHWESFKSGEIALIKSCLDDLMRIKSHKEFFSVYINDGIKIDFTEIQNCLESLDWCVTHQNGCSESINQWVVSIDEQIGTLDILKRVFLDHSEMDKFCVENSDAHPY